MTTAAIPAAPRAGGVTFSRLVELGLRELRAGLSGFYIFIACVALGVAVITGVGSLADGLRRGFEAQGEAILGGDVTFSRMHARADGESRDWILAQGRASETATLRSMARRADDGDAALVELKAVDEAYPLVGAVELAGATFADAVRRDGGVAVDPILLERLGLKIGDAIKIGEAEFTVRATVTDEPDGIADRLTYGPRVFLSLASLEKTKLVQPGTLVRWRYAVSLPPAAPDLATFRERAKAAVGDDGYTLADRRDPSPQVSRALDRLRQFLTLLGLTALLVGGVGVANSVATFVERRRNDIATMKSLGAPARVVFAILLVEVLVIAGIGVAIGILAGLALPPLLTWWIGDMLPIEARLGVSWLSMLWGAGYGFLVALLFALWPLGRAARIRANVLFRDEVAPESVRPPRAVIFATLLIAASLFALAVLTSDSQRLALYFCGAVAVVFLVFAGLGSFVTWLARRVPRPRTPELALAIANLGAPGGLTRSVTMSLGAGLSLLVAVALADASLVEELTGRLPQHSPNYFVLDVTRDDYPAVEALVKREAPGANLVVAPMLRGRLVELKGQSVEKIKPPAEAQWVLNGDRGLTYAETVPKGSTLVEGEWWPADYSGEPLVSFEKELAHHLGLKIGDSVTVNVLGRNLTARISNLREVKWETLSLNFVMVYSPNALSGAPHNLLATITLPETTTLAGEAQVARALSKAYPGVTVIRVKDALDAFKGVFGKVMTAVRVAGSVTLLAGALVLAGALTTAQRRRVLEAVILKVLGATRRRILATHFAEYMLLASATAAFAVLLGAAAAWVAVSRVMEIEFIFTWPPVAQALGLATFLVLLFGGLGTLSVLRARPVAALRSE